MRTTVITTLLAGLASLASAALTKDSVEITGGFPKINQFGIVLNGEPNKFLLKIANLGKDPLDVVNIKTVSSEFREIGGKERVLRKNKPIPFKGSIPPGKPVTLPYSFSSELKEGNVNFRVYVEWTTSQGLKETTVAYDSTVTISEPPTRWFDPQLILLYVILGSGIGFAGYVAFTAYSAPDKTTRRTKPTVVVTESKAPLVSTPGGGKYQEEWIPQGHVKKAPGSGAESGGDTSGAEGKVRRRKR